MNLYAKIFLGFWLSMLAIAGSWMIANHYVDSWPGAGSVDKQAPANSEDRHRLGPGAPPPRQMYRIYYGLQNVEAGELREWIATQEKQHDLRIYLVDPAGNEIFQRELETGTAEAIEKLGRFRRRTIFRNDDVTLLAQRLHRPEWGSLTMVVAVSPPASPIVRLLTEHLWLRLLLAVLISGLISYMVSRYLTRPLKELQTASRRLAEGDLDARIAVPRRGGDETAELARDFNTMADQLQQRMQEQKRLLHDVSHELRSPLARMQLAIALAERDPGQAGEQLARMQRETERLDELIAQLLALPGDRLPLGDSIDLVSLLREISDDASYEGSAEGKRVRLDTSESEVICSTHGDLLKKALENVVRNALHYTRENSVVNISLSAGSHGWIIGIDDQGPGIPPEDLERVFEPFFRVDDARSRETGGYGLGLAIAKRAIDQHDGLITARNTDSGLQIRIELPVA